jgi:hypothetical protein
MDSQWRKRSLGRNRRTLTSRYLHASYRLRQGSLLAAIGSGEGVLTFHGKHYPFIVAGASIGATIGVSASVLRGAAHFISSPGDLAGTYTGVGGGAAVAAGISAVKLRNEKSVVLELRGAKLGVEVSANLPLVTITMK